jgi:predicted O-linked N-acetylglucosamine transferase (SPINDLY family)
MPGETQPSSLPAQLERAMARHQAGDLEMATRLYLEILQREPRHFEALHHLGVARAQAGDAATAMRHLTAAIAVNPQSAEAHVHLAHARMAVGDTEAALRIYDQALVLRPEYPEALYCRGNALQALQRHADAVESYDRALALAPDRPEILTNRGNALHDLKRFDEALADYDRALALPKNVPMLHNNRGNTLREMKRHAEALAEFDRALALEPGYLDARVNRGNALQDLRRHHEALAEFDRALDLSPHAAVLHSLRGGALHDLNHPADAVESYQRALRLDPANPETLYHYAIVLYDLARYREALASLDRSLELKSDDVKAINNRIQCLLALRRHEEAAVALARLLALAPDWDYAQGDLFHSRAHCCDWTAYGSCAQGLVQAVAEGRKAATPLPFLAVTASAAAQRDCAQTYAADKYPASVTPLWTGNPYAHDRIRVAYVSADFREHAVSHLMTGVLERHDRRRFEITGFSLRPDDGSPASRRVRAALGNVVDVFGKVDAEIAALLRGMQIDIAVDLTGHTFGGRTAVFAHRPAPVHVNYLGFPGTMGAPFMDYLIADPVVVPPGQRKHYAESIVYLPECFQANDDRRDIGAIRPTRPAAGLPEAGLVFCCFNNSYKITPPVFERWLSLLQAVPDSVLWLFASRPVVARNLREEARRRSADPGRLVFAEGLPYADYLARMQLADLFLDTSPFNGGTTASDALWAGVPVLTCPGEAFASRMAASLLNAVGLPELIASSWEDYEALALKLALDRGLLAQIKAKLAHNRATYPLFNTDRFRRHIEAAYVTMWERVQRGESPASFAVPGLP